MRILHLIHSEGLYGAERILLYLAREQQRLGHAPVIGSIADPGAPAGALEARAAALGLPVLPLRIAPRPTPAVVRRLLAATAGARPQVLHSHGYKANILLGFLDRARRGPMLATLHGWTAAPGLSRLRLYEWLDARALRHLEAVVVVARGMLSLPPRGGVAPQRRHVIENGIPPREERLAELAQLGVAPPPAALAEFMARAPTWVAIGRLAPEKGFDLLLRAFARALRAGPPARQLLIVGEGPERARLTQLIVDLGLGEQARLAGFLEGAERLLEHAAGFVMSSHTEGMPLVLLEALQWRRPLIATAVGAIPELLQQGALGTLVAAGDEAALARALGAQELRASAAPPPWSSRQMAERYLETYAAIL